MFEIELPSFKQDCTVDCNARLVGGIVGEDNFPSRKLGKRCLSTLWHKRLFKCKECSARFRNNSILEAHNIRKHGMNEISQCLTCTSVFTTRRSLDEHHRCIMCSLGFARSAHLECQSQRLVHECEVCKAPFRSVMMLADHRWRRSIDEGIQLFKCDMCDAKFTTKHQIRCHSGTHVSKAFDASIEYTESFSTDFGHLERLVYYGQLKCDMSFNCAQNLPGTAIYGSMCGPAHAAREMSAMNMTRISSREAVQIIT